MALEWRKSVIHKNIQHLFEVGPTGPKHHLGWVQELHEGSHWVAYTTAEKIGEYRLEEEAKAVLVALVQLDSESTPEQF